MGCATANVFGPAPWGTGEELKGQISFNFNYKVNFIFFLYQTVCVFSQMKDTKQIRPDFYSVAWAMPQGWDFGALGVKKIKHDLVAYRIHGDEEQNRMQVIFLS